MRLSTAIKEKYEVTSAKELDEMLFIKLKDLAEFVLELEEEGIDVNHLHKCAKYLDELSMLPFIPKKK